MPINPDLTSLEYTARLLSAVMRQEVTADDLETNAEQFGVIVHKLIQSSNDNATVVFTFDGRRYHASVGLTNVAKAKLGQTVKTLANVQQPAQAR